MKILKNIGLLVASLVASYCLDNKFFEIYNYFWPALPPGGLFAPYAALADALIGLFVALTFFPILLFTALGDKYKYWWIGVLMLPVLWFVIQFDLAHWYFYLALAPVGWLLGLGVSRLIKLSQTAKS